MGDEDKDYIIDLSDMNIDIGNITVSGSSNIDYDQWMQDYISTINIDNDWVYNTGPSLQSDNISLSAGGDEMLRIAPDGFYVRGVKVPAGKKEAKAVYNAFKSWMTAAILSGEIKN